jgi:hypothetical protein
LLNARNERSSVQWAIVDPLTALAFAGAAQKEPAAA